MCLASLARSKECWMRPSSLLNAGTVWCTEDVIMGIKPSENLPVGHHLKWTQWKSLSRLRTGYGRAAALMHHWGYRDNPFCSCGDLETMQHLLLCEKLHQTCTKADIHMTNSTAIETALYWADTIWKHTLAYKRQEYIMPVLTGLSVGGGAFICEPLYRPYSNQDQSLWVDTFPSHE